MKLDITTLIGVSLAMALVGLGMLLATGGNIPLFIALFVYQPASAAITVGGSMGGTLASFPLTKIKKLLPIVMKTIMCEARNTEYRELISELVSYATEARRNGVLALDARTEDMEDPFIRGGIQLAVDGTAPEQIEEIMQLELDFLRKRHRENQAIILKWGELAPAFGMIGTLVGLIAMLANLSDPDAIGPAMALALVTTLYGSMLANMICIPLAGKLQQRTEEELIRKEIIISAVLAIQNGDNPRIVQKKLMTYVTKDIREQLASEEIT
jgi:chemotaxis protein MotA